MIFTKERLQEIAEDGFLKHGESKELARMALAELTAEPIYQACKEAGVWVDIEPQDVDSLRFNGEQIRKVYTAPTATVVPDGVARKDFEAWARGAGFNEDWYFFTNTHPNHYDDDHVNHMWASWSACRAAMLQGGK